MRVAKSPLGNSVSQPASLNKATSVASGWHQTSPSSSQLSHPIVPMGYQKSNLEAVEDDPGLEDEGCIPLKLLDRVDIIPPNGRRGKILKP